MTRRLGDIKHAVQRQENAAPAGGGGGAAPTWAELEARRDGLVRLLTFGMHLAPEDAEDVTSDVILKAKVRGGIRNLAAWLDGAAVFGGIDLIRQRQRREEHMERIARSRELEAIAAAAEAERRDLVELVQRAIAALPERLHRVWLRAQNDETVQDLAVLLGVTPRRVYQLLAEAERLLREGLGPRL
jgi:RNA polymerase sigma factor (sigma-70 family)